MGQGRLLVVVTRHLPPVVETRLKELFDVELRDPDNSARPSYRKTSAYGHFGRADKDFTWERCDRAEELAIAIAKASRHGTGCAIAGNGSPASAGTRNCGAASASKIASRSSGFKNTALAGIRSFSSGRCGPAMNCALLFRRTFP